jgi:hypothetical protein
MENGKQGAFASMNEFERQEGLTKREYFAGLAMQGMAMSDLKFEDIAHDAVKMADAVLAELEKTEQ